VGIAAVSVGIAAVEAILMWFESAPPCETEVPCGDDTHVFRWEGGALRLPSHPDAEAELVLAALGGEKADCVRLAEVWTRHTDDLSVLAIGTRGPADQITVDWNAVHASESGSSHAGWTTMAGPPPGPPTSTIASAVSGVVSGVRSTPMRYPMRPGHGPQAMRQAMQAERDRAQQRITDHLSLLALGPAFGLRLAGHVAAAHAECLTDAGYPNRPALNAATEGRVALLAEEWIGIDPDQVYASVHEDPGWGTVQLTGNAADRRLTITLPPAWLATVWACGLGLVARHLVVDVLRPGWPQAQVLALPAPGADPVTLHVQGTADAAGNPHWEYR
jgi:hypothetical protein